MSAEASKTHARPIAAIVYVKEDCRYSSRMLDEMRRAGERPIVIDVDRERYVIPELLKLTGGRRIVPVRVRGTEVAVAPDGGTEF